MRVVFLVESVTAIWGGVVRVLDDADRLTDRGHEVVVLAKDAPVPWHAPRAEVRRVADFDRATIPDCDVVVATFWTTVPAAVQCRRGVPVHYCQGFEPLGYADAGVRAAAATSYRLPAHRITISPHLTELVQEASGQPAHEITYAIDPDTMHAGPARPVGRPLRVGLVGPYGVGWKGIGHGIEACRLVRDAGLPVQLVRVTNTDRHPDEAALDLPTEWHDQVAPARMGAIYRGLDVMLATSVGREEGFFLPAVEAMACGVPTVLTDVPCFRGYADRHDYALFVEPGNAQEMAEAIVLLGQHQGLREQIRAAGLRVARRFDPHQHVAELERALAAALGAGKLDVPSGPQSTATPPERPRAPLRPSADPDADGLVERLTRRGERLAEAEEFAAAARSFEAALCLAPDDDALCERTAIAACLADDADRGLALLERLVARGGATPRVHERRGLILMAKDRFREAAAAFELAVQDPLAKAAVFNSLGVALFELGDHAGARAAFDEALRRDPNHADARSNRDALRAAARRRSGRDAARN